MTSYRRYERRIRAQGLTVTIFSRDGKNIVGGLDNATWFEDWEQLSMERSGPWQDLKCNVQLSGRLKNTPPGFGFMEHEYRVSFAYAGEQRTGPVLVQSGLNQDFVFHVQGGFDQDAD